MLIYFQSSSLFCLQGPYPTPEKYCASLSDSNQEETLVNNITVATSLDSLPKALFSRLYTGTSSSLLPRHLLHGISVQDTSGRVLACGRLETLFAVDAAYNGKGVLNQFMQFLHPGITDPSGIGLLQYNIVDNLPGHCSSSSTVFNPWMAPVMQDYAGLSLDLIPIGALPYHEIEFFSVLPEVPLIGSATIIGHTVSLQKYIQFLIPIV